MKKRKIAQFVAGALAVLLIAAPLASAVYASPLEETVESTEAAVETTVADENKDYTVNEKEQKATDSKENSEEVKDTETETKESETLESTAGSTKSEETVKGTEKTEKETEAVKETVEETEAEKATVSEKETVAEKETGDRETKGAVNETVTEKATEETEAAQEDEYYKIVFINNGENASSSKKKMHRAPAAMPADAAHDNIAFTVRFYTNGGTLTEEQMNAYSSLIHKVGQPIGELPTPSYDADHDFLGWYSEETGGELIPASYVPTGDISVYAHWKINCYYIHFDTEDATGPDDLIVESPTHPGVMFVHPVEKRCSNDATHVTLQENPYVREGYHLLGWSKTQYGTTVDYESGGTYASFLNKTFTFDDPSQMDYAGQRFIYLYPVWEQDATYECPLVIKNQVTGNLSDKSLTTNIIIHAANGAGSDIVYAITDKNGTSTNATATTDSNGNITVTLKNGDTITVQNIPKDFPYKVTMSDSTYNAEAGARYTVTIQDPNGTADNSSTPVTVGVMKTNMETITITHDRAGVIPTGIHTEHSMLYIISMLSMIAMASCFLKKKAEY